MHLPTTTSLINLLFLTTTISLQVVLASPLSFTEIERRWSAGETDASIHAAHNPHSASPAWPLALTTRSTSHFASSAFSSSESGDYDSESFAESYDAVTQRGVIGRKRSVESSAALSARIRDFASRLLRSKGESGMIAEKKRGVVDAEGEAPVLRPGRVRYSFSS